MSGDEADHDDDVMGVAGAIWYESTNDTMATAALDAL